MKLKLDENLDVGLVALFNRDGHDVTTVLSERLGGKSDSVIFEACCREKRILVTQDLDFSNVLRFPPARTAGIIVLRGPDQLLSTTRKLIQAVLTALETTSPNKALWIVEAKRIRVYSDVKPRKTR